MSKSEQKIALNIDDFGSLCLLAFRYAVSQEESELVFITCLIESNLKFLHKRNMASLMREAGNVSVSDNILHAPYKELCKDLVNKIVHEINKRPCQSIDNDV